MKPIKVISSIQKIIQTNFELNFGTHSKQKTRKNKTSKSKTKIKQFPNQRLRWTWINELFLLMLLLLLESKVPFEIFLKHAFFHLLIIPKKKKQKIQNCNKFYYMKLTCRYTAQKWYGVNVCTSIWICDQVALSNYRSAGRG